MGILNKTDFKEIDLIKQTINYKKMEKLTLEDCFKYPNARIVIAGETLLGNIRCFGIPDSPQRLDALEKYGQLQLRPLSSLTGEERFKVGKIILLNDDIKAKIKYIDYLRSINIDIDDLQEKGVAVYE